jgi:hypothetical protein
MNSAAIAKILDAIQPVVLTGVAMASGVFLLIPDKTYSELGILTFVESIKGWVFIAFLLALCLLIAKGLASVSGWGKGAIEEHRSKGYIKSYLKRMSKEEKSILRTRFVETRKTSNAMMADWGPVESLIKHGVLSRGERITLSVRPGTQEWFYLEQWILKYLLDHPKLLKEGDGD